MPAPSIPRVRSALSLASFTLIELLTVIVIIGILAALTLTAATAVMKTAARDRARTEVKAMETALETYKSDNGAYPPFDFAGGTNSYTVASATAGGGGYYPQSSQALYQALSGQVNGSTVVAGQNPTSRLTALSCTMLPLGRVTPMSSILSGTAMATPRARTPPGCRPIFPIMGPASSISGPPRAIPRRPTSRRGSITGAVAKRVRSPVPHLRVMV